MNVLDVCAGVGSFSLAAESAGMDTVCQIEIDPYRQSVLRKHFPNAQKLTDIYQVDADDIDKPIDLLCGGTPCQDLSIAGNGAGLDGTKSSLWYEFLRLAQELKPRWLVWENVSNALSSNGGRDFAAILRGLDECGYHVAWRVLDAQYFGVPQRRRRIFLVGHLGDGRAAKVLFESASLPGNSNTRPTAREKTTRLAGTLPKSASEPVAINWQAGSSADYMTRKGGIAGTLGVTRVEGVHYDKVVRRLTPTEYARLQGFPDDYLDGLNLSDSKKYEMWGDTIALPCSMWILRRIADLEMQEVA